MTEEKAGGGIKAKPLTLAGQVFAAAWVAGWASAKFIKSGIAAVELKDIIYSGAAIVCCFSPVFFNMVMDKIQKIRFGDGNE